jgi:hypothetical protein
LSDYFMFSDWTFLCVDLGSNNTIAALGPLWSHCVNTRLVLEYLPEFKVDCCVLCHLLTKHSYLIL